MKTELNTELKRECLFPREKVVDGAIIGFMKRERSMEMD
jgi:hypothetical protein